MKFHISAPDGSSEVHNPSKSPHIVTLMGAHDGLEAIRRLIFK